MHPDLEKLVSRGKIDSLTAQQLELLPPGTFCQHKSWGAGKVVDWDRLGVKLIVDFEDKSGHELGMKFAAMSLTPIEEGSFLAKRYTASDELKALAASDPVELVRLVLSSHGDRLFLDKLEELLKGYVIPEGKYKGWWESTKKKLRENMQFIVPAKRTDPLELREEDFDPSQGLIADFREARDLRAKVKAVEAIIKEINAFKDHQDNLIELVAEISEIARKGVKLQYAPAVELILIREELQGKLKGFDPDNGQISTAEILAADENAIPGLFEDLSLTRLRQVLKSFPGAFGEEAWVDKMLGLIPACNLRSIAEIASYLDTSGRKDAIIAYMENGLQQRTITSDSLAWICRERKGLSQSVFTPTLCLSVMSSLEADQLNDEGSVRAANRLRDLVADDNGLIPDLISGANINTIRNFASRLVTSASFDELTRKSLMARVIKLHPEIQDLMHGREKEQEETLIVSEPSLNEKKAAYDKLIKEEIPQNREDIKIARAYGDLRENFEYKASKEYQRILMKRQNDWERDLKLAQPTDFSDPDTSKVSIGTVVTLDAVDGGDPLSYTVLGAWDSDPDNGIIAYLSERGNAILDKTVGSDVDFPLGDGGMKRYRITSIKAYKS
ncbi:MAG TPA: GreA/GreB family elongation factor [Verrucomicrobiales bacterium]|nr:GreA/GreB family elongation factor [Verrucomicrobiales bacterium]